MIRIFFLYALPLLLPTIIYILWVRREMAKKPGTQYKIIPLPLLLTTGIILVAIILGIFVIEDRAPPDSSYTRAKFEDGKLIPAKLDVQ